MEQLPDGITVSDVKCLPIIAAYVNRLGIIDAVNRACPAEGCDVSPGHIVAAMIMDTLSGRNPLYRLEKAFEHVDVEPAPAYRSDSKNLMMTQRPAH